MNDDAVASSSIVIRPSFCLALRPRRAARRLCPPPEGDFDQHAAQPDRQGLPRAELELIAALCQEYDVLAIADEVYDRLVYDRAAHVPLATLPGMWERTLTLNSAGKTFSVTGWKIG